MSEHDEISEWWADNPMTYGDAHGAAAYEGNRVAMGSEAFFAEVDRTFLEWNRPLHGERPFSRLFPYPELDGARVLEVGCGMGTMASLVARAGAHVTAVDLNPVAVQQTRRRFELLGLDGDIRQADGTALPFDDATFDYVWSWGVLHHSPDLDRSLGELLRVLRPGGGYGVMVYHRHSFLHQYMTRYLEGFLHLERRFLSPLELASRYTDGGREEGNPHTWPVTRKELTGMLRRHTSDVAIRTLGTDLDAVFEVMSPGIGVVLPTFVKKPFARRFGWSLWAHGKKR